MGAKKTTVDAAAGFFDDITPARDVQQVQSVQDVHGVQTKNDGTPDKRYVKKVQDGVHLNVFLPKDDFTALGDLAYQQRRSRSELIRDIIAEYVQKHA